MIRYLLWGIWVQFNNKNPDIPQINLIFRGFSGPKPAFHAYIFYNLVTSFAFIRQPFMKKIVPFILILLFYACGKKGEFVDEIQGEWKVAEVQYIYDNVTYTEYPPDMHFKFQSYSYQTWQDGSVYESGNFNVNPKATQITFQSGLIDKVYLIEENTQENQTWKSKNKILDFYLKFKLEKL